YPTGFFAAFSATLFFLAGRYNSVDKSFEKGSISFNVMMVAFYFFTGILLLNLLIALMYDVFTESTKDGAIIHLDLLAEIVAEVETYSMSNNDRDRGDYYPKYMYYCASEEEIARFRTKYSISGVSYLSAENRFQVETSGADASSIQRTIINDNIMALGKDMVEQSRRQDEESYQSRRQYEELARLRALVESFRSNDEVKQELAELKELVKNLASQQKTNVSS
ncbi:hypothetical protein BGZ65_008758, partial [Modicella reniformis]